MCPFARQGPLNTTAVCSVQPKSACLHIASVKLIGLTVIGGWLHDCKSYYTLVGEFVQGVMTLAAREMPEKGVRSPLPATNEG
jgi:hypothetical protein